MLSNALEDGQREARLIYWIRFSIGTLSSANDSSEKSGTFFSISVIGSCLRTIGQKIVLALPVNAQESDIYGSSIVY